MVEAGEEQTQLSDTAVRQIIINIGRRMVALPPEPVQEPVIDRISEYLIIPMLRAQVLLPEGPLL